MKTSTVKEHYNSNKEIKEYIDAYAKDNNITVDEAFEHLVVKYYVTWKIESLSQL